MDMLLWTALTKYHLQAPQCATEITPTVGVIDPHLGIIATPGIPTMIIEIGTGSAVPDPTHTTLDTGVTATMTPAGVTPDHFIDLHIVALHGTEAQVHTAYCHDTPHHASRRNFSWDDSRSQLHRSHKKHYKPAQGSSSSSQTTPWKNKDRRHKQVTIEDPSYEYYSSDEQDSDSEDDLN